MVLRLYTQESRRHHGILLYEWLLEQAKQLGIHGGSVFRAIAGFGRHGVLHEQHFFELAGDLPVVAEFVCVPEEAERLLALLQRERVDVMYARWPAELGSTVTAGAPGASGNAA